MASGRRPGAAQALLNWETQDGDRSSQSQTVELPRLPSHGGIFSRGLVAPCPPCHTRAEGCMKHHTEAKEALEPCPKTGRETKTTGGGQSRPIAVGAGSSGAGGAGDILVVTRPPPRD